QVTILRQLAQQCSSDRVLDEHRVAGTQRQSVSIRHVPSSWLHLRATLRLSISGLPSLRANRAGALVLSTGGFRSWPPRVATRAQPEETPPIATRAFPFRGGGSSRSAGLHLVWRALR